MNIEQRLFLVESTVIEQAETIERLEGEIAALSRAGSPLTRLTQEGRLVALEEKREGHHVYVTPAHVDGRDVWPGYRHKEHHCETCTCESKDE